MGRHEVPFIRLSEYRINFNSLIQNIKYQLAIVGERGGIETLSSLTKGVGLAEAQAAGGVVGDDKAQKKAEEQAAKDKAGADKRGAQGAKIKEKLGTVQGNDALPNYLKPYWGLYGATPSGFE